LEKGIKELRLDLINVQKGKGMKVSRVTSNGDALTFKHKNDELYIKLPVPSSVNQHSQYTISYRGIPAGGFKIADNKYGDRTFFSDNWPNKARHWLPLIDHPYDKAMCEFVVTAPDHYQVISNGLLIEETDGPNGKRLTHWKQSVPIAPWLFVLGVAHFAVQYVDTFDEIDAINYIFNIELSDETDEIICESKVDVRYLEKGIKELRLDLINVQKGKGMKVSRVTSNGDALTFKHKNDELYIKLPVPSSVNQRSQYTISYRGLMP